MSPIPLIDAHCHPEAYSPEDWSTVEQSALNAHVHGCLAAAIWWDSFTKLHRRFSSALLARVKSKETFISEFQSPSSFRILASIGLHPMEVARHWRNPSGFFDSSRAEQDIAFLRQIARSQRSFIWAVGETGFDASKECLLGWSSKAELLVAQDFAFLASVELAVELEVPLIIHSRAAWGHTLSRIREAKTSGLGKFMIHCYPGPASDLKELARLEGLASFGGVITWNQARRMREALVAASTDVFLVETDAPDLAPHLPHSSAPIRNEPQYLAEIVRVAAELRKETPENIAKMNLENLMRFFSLSE